MTYSLMTFSFENIQHLYLIRLLFFSFLIVVVFVMLVVLGIWYRRYLFMKKLSESLQIQKEQFTRQNYLKKAQNLGQQELVRLSVAYFLQFHKNVFYTSLDDFFVDLGFGSEDAKDCALCFFGKKKLSLEQEKLLRSSLI